MCRSGLSAPRRSGTRRKRTDRRTEEREPQSLGTVERVNEPWLCDPANANLWAGETLQDYFDETKKQFEEILRGLLDSGILASALMPANFRGEVREHMDGPEALDLGSAGEARRSRSRQGTFDFQRTVHISQNFPE